MPLENQNSAPEKNVENPTVSDQSSANLSTEAQSLLQDNSMNERSKESESNLSSVLPNSENFLTQDKETQDAFGLENNKDSNKVGDDGQPIDKAEEDAKDNGDIKDKKADSTENPKAETSADKANAHDSTEVDQQEGESLTDNKDVAAHKDGKDKKGKTGDADKDTDDGVDNQAGEKVNDTANSGKPGAESTSLGSEVNSGDNEAKSENKDDSSEKKTQEKPDADSEAFGSDIDSSKQPSIQPPPMQINEVDQNNAKGTENITKAAGQEHGTDIYANAAIPVLNEVSQNAASNAGNDSTNSDATPESKTNDTSSGGSESFGNEMDSSKHPSIEPSQMQSSDVDQSNIESTESIIKAQGQDSSDSGNPVEPSAIDQGNNLNESSNKAAQASLNSGLNYASTAALYERSVSLT